MGEWRQRQKKNKKQDALIALLRSLKHYVEDNCGNDVAVVLSSGFQPAVNTRNRSPLANPTIIGVDFGNNSGELVPFSPLSAIVLLCGS